MTDAAPRTSPDQTRTTLPPGIPFIIGNELAERFSFYGMKGILTVFMTTHLLDAAGNEAFLSDEAAKKWYHIFGFMAYIFPLLGAYISDVFLGKYRTILFLSLLYCVGHGCLAVMDAGPSMGMDMWPWFVAGLVIIAMGAGAIKPCVSAHVGDQFGAGNKHLVSRTFSWFYFSINIGAAASSFLTPLFLKHYGPWLAFGVPGVLMALATFVFWLGRNRFIHVPPSGHEKFFNETFSPEGLRALVNLAPIFLLFVPAFWTLFDQTGSAWVLQAKSMDRNFLGIEWLESQVQVVNPVLILILIPTFAYVVYPALDRVWTMTPLRKIGIGMFTTAAAFSISAWIEGRIDAGETPNIAWQFLAYAVLTSAEVMVSITTLEFAYTQAPKKMKSFIMGIYFAGVAIGNLFAAGVNWWIEAFKNEDGTSALDGAAYYWFFTYLMIAVSVVFVFFAIFYKGQTFIQGEDHKEVFD